MRMVVLIGAAVIAAAAFAASGALAGVVSRAECGDRIVKKPLVPARPGCQYKTCRITYTREHDNKGDYCLEHRGCLVVCNKR
jgi:hypothetical protein